MAHPLIVVTGTYRKPELRAYFSRNAPHPLRPGKGLHDLMKSLDSAYFRKSKKHGDHWLIQGLGRFDADALFDRAGFEIDFESETYDTDLEGVDTLDELVDPIMQLASDRRMVLIRPRLLGFKMTKELLGSGAMWDRERQRFYMPVGDLLKKGEPRPDLNIPEDALEAAWEQHERIHTDDGLISQASKAALAKDVVDLTDKEIKALTDQVGDIPKWFGLPLYPYQRVGALAVAAGHNLLADGMRVGKTRTSLAVAAMRGARRTIIVAPPVVLTNWERNVDECLLATLGGKQPDGKIVEFRTGRKEPELPEDGVVIISDSLLTSRKHLQDAIVEWEPDVMIYDEAIDLEEPILTTDGWKTVGSVRQGDFVFAPSGKPVSVKRLTPIKDNAECFRVSLSDGSSVVVDAGHLWLAEPRVGGGRKYLNARVVTTKHLVESMTQGRVWRLPEVSPVEGSSKELPLPPYVLGAWLGDGSVRQPHLAAAKDRTDAFVAELGRHWSDVRVIRTSPHKADRVSLADAASVGGKPSVFRIAAERIGVWNDKHIPDDYLSASVDQRLELLRGLMDTDGHVSRVHGKLRNVFTFSNSNRRIIDGFVYLVRSLGMIPGVHENKNYGRGNESACWRVSFTAAPGMKIFSMRNEDSVFEQPHKSMKRRIVSIEPVESRRVRCIEVDSEDHLFLVGKSLIPTHNCHRAKNFESARTRAVLRVAAASDFPLPMTGTPLFQTPQELAPLLEMTGHLTPVFGGLDEFMEAYCWQNKWGGWAPRVKTLPGLRKMLDTYVWVRRTKDQVLKDLPKVSRGDLDLDIDLKLFNAAHREVSEKVAEWIEEFREDFGRLPSHTHTDSKGKSVDEIAEFARDRGIEFISKLRRAAGLAKVPSAVEYIKEHVYSTTEKDENGRKVFTRPLLVWTYHTEVSEEMSKVVPNEVDDAAIIMGGISQNKRQRLIDEFQDGKIPVLVCQISAAGVGIDLTRSSDAVFVETDWVNALVQQAEERVQGVNQKRPVMLTTMVARGTLDDRIQRVLHEKSKILDPLLGGNNDVSVVEVEDEEASASAVLIEIIDTELRKLAKGKRR